LLASWACSIAVLAGWDQWLARRHSRLADSLARWPAGSLDFWISGLLALLVLLPV